MSGLSEQLRAQAAEIWDAQHRHPFVRGIADGTLDKERFRFWIRQDYLFLIEYSRLLALATARAPDLDTMGRFADLLHETLHGEMRLHRSYCSDLGIGEADLEREQMAPTTRGYTDFSCVPPPSATSPNCSRPCCPVCGGSTRSGGG